MNEPTIRLVHEHLCYLLLLSYTVSAVKKGTLNNFLFDKTNDPITIYELHSCLWENPKQIIDKFKKKFFLIAIKVTLNYGTELIFENKPS